MVITNSPLKDQLLEDGYFIAKSILSESLDLEPVRKEYKNELNSLAKKWHNQQKIQNTYEELPIGKQLVKILSDYPDAPYYEDLDITLPKNIDGIKDDKDTIQNETIMQTGPAIFNLLTSPRLLDVIEEFIGPEIYSNPVQHVRIKPPFNILPKGIDDKVPAGLVTRAQWHQDQGVVLTEADNTEMLTVWIPLTKATTENGCLVVGNKSHTNGLALHCMRTTERPQWKGIEIPLEYIKENKIPLEMQPGDVLFMTKFTKHSSLENNTNAIRWSFDLRYQPIGQPTGRPYFPGFVARSRKNPESELKDHKEWRKLWMDAKEKLVNNVNYKNFNRWDPKDRRCA